MQSLADTVPKLIRIDSAHLAPPVSIDLSYCETIEPFVELTMINGNYYYSIVTTQGQNVVDDVC